MSIRLLFGINTETFLIEVKDREIFYCDRKMIKKVRLIPSDKELHKRIVMSRNKIPNYIWKMWSLTEEEKKEYENAKTDGQLAEICIKDCKKNGARLLKKDSEM